jgi:hypothetical protein
MADWQALYAQYSRNLRAEEQARRNAGRPGIFNGLVLNFSRNGAGPAPRRNNGAGPAPRRNNGAGPAPRRNVPVTVARLSRNNASNMISAKNFNNGNIVYGIKRSRTGNAANYFTPKTIAVLMRLGLRTNTRSNNQLRAVVNQMPNNQVIAAVNQILANRTTSNFPMPKMIQGVSFGRFTTRKHLINTERALTKNNIFKSRVEIVNPVTVPVNSQQLAPAPAPNYNGPYVEYY